MTAIEMQAGAELEASRRKMQAWRSTKNKIALTLSLATMAFGLFWLVWILFTTVTHGIGGLSLDAVHRIDAAAEHRGRWPGERPGGQRPADPLGDLLRHAAGHPGGHLPGRIRP